jgi:predicted PurR-regulated permease PerM
MAARPECERVRVPRYVGVFVVYATFVAIVVVNAALVWPPVVEQLRNLAADASAQRACPASPQ